MTEALDLARRAVACKHWKWMPGMLMLKAGIDWRIIDPDLRMDGDELPVLTDPATIGCMLALVREAWNSSRLQVSPMLPTGGWVCYLNNTDERYGPYYRGDTEAAALFAALEAAP